MDLYDNRLNTTNWAKMCGGGNGEDENTEACVEYAEIPDHAHAIVIRDSKNPHAGELRFTGDEMRVFVMGYAARHGITL
ncbi:DUF397 domain-containing protein [Actinokineospora iranica]|uniref:DUF397 domain-containing protein n=1 Tax=Actinokineospora iranica TaxID=1271860 RepID=A0A1G6KDQ0_9PSEU|nr:DUF397 domain-containing protein [Actinokineospora iranica]SDC29130.1 protein of unknown function [Actinokineospora iranica]